MRKCYIVEAYEKETRMMGFVKLSHQCVDHQYCNNLEDAREIANVWKQSPYGNYKTRIFQLIEE